MRWLVEKRVSMNAWKHRKFVVSQLRFQNVKKTILTRGVIGGKMWYTTFDQIKLKNHTTKREVYIEKNFTIL